MKRYFRFIYASSSKGNHNRQSSENDASMLLAKHAKICVATTMEIYLKEETVL